MCAAESLTLTGALAAVFSLAACVKVQPNLQQVIAEDPRLPLLEGLFTVEGLEKLARPNALYLVSLLWGTPQGSVPACENCDKSTEPCCKPLDTNPRFT